MDVQLRTWLASESIGLITRPRPMWLGLSFSPGPQPRADGCADLGVVTMFNAQSDAGSGLAVLSVSARPSAAGNAPPGLVQSSSSPVGSSM